MATISYCDMSKDVNIDVGYVYGPESPTQAISVRLDGANIILTAENWVAIADAVLDARADRQVERDRLARIADEAAKVMEASNG